MKRLLQKMYNPHFLLIAFLLICLGFASIQIYKEKFIGREEVQQSVEQEKLAIPHKYIGEFSISHYCSCPKCTGTPKGSKTSTGHIPKEGRTVAVDKSLIPLHSIIYVEGLGTYVAEDVGGAIKGKHLDIYIDDHQKALNLGTLGGKKFKVYVLE